MSQLKRGPMHDVIVVGAGAAGLGIGVALQHAGVENVLIVDRHEVGASFQRWPRETTFLTPSFPTNSIGMLDLNAIAIGTSPGYILECEHPDGKTYARYLKGVARFFELNVETELNVEAVHHHRDYFTLETIEGTLTSRFVVWAAGEFQYPRRHSFPGAEFCRHYGLVESFQEYPAKNEVLVIGGYESGIDAAIQLASRGKEVTVLSRNANWDEVSSDPSISLSVYTKERLRTVMKLGGKIELVEDAEIVQVNEISTGCEVQSADGRVWQTTAPPVLATGFLGSHLLLHGLFEAREDGYPLLTAEDESTRLPGLYLSGPMVRHDRHVFCFIYKFRQRFAVVAKSIATRLNLPAAGLEMYRQWGMYLDDLSCCGEECVC